MRIRWVKRPSKHLVQIHAGDLGRTLRRNWIRTGRVGSRRHSLWMVRNDLDKWSFGLTLVGIEESCWRRSSTYLLLTPFPCLKIQTWAVSTFCCRRSVSTRACARLWSSTWVLRPLMRHFSTRHWGQGQLARCLIIARRILEVMRLTHSKRINANDSLLRIISQVCKEPRKHPLSYTIGTYNNNSMLICIYKFRIQ